VSLLCEEKANFAEAGSSGSHLTPNSTLISQQPIKLLAKENSQVICLFLNHFIKQLNFHCLDVRQKILPTLENLIKLFIEHW
jgi:hypothetical protein